MPAVKQLLRDLIALPSVNPAFTHRDDPCSGESRVASYLAKLCGKEGISFRMHEALPGRSNLIASLAPKSRRKRTVLLAPHLDTVSVSDPGQLIPRSRGGRIHGRGACDTKGSVAAMFTAFLAMARGSRRPANTEIVFAGLVDEENGQAGSRSLVKSGFQADLALVGEPTLLRAVTAHKGDLWLKIRTQGRAAHSSQPQHGDNAIARMARVVSMLEGLYAKSLRKHRHPLLGCATVNVGMIQGGKQPNIVPDACEIAVDRRTLPGETDARVMREISRLLRTNGCQVQMEDWKGAPSLAMETDPTLPDVRRLMKLTNQRMAMGVHYFSDAGVLAAGGVPSVVIGPGDIAQAHTVDEWIELEQLETGARLFGRFLEGLE
ncbi:MAG: M20 family metallopeptidase [Verrucomicrobia bacterium]|nr:M20 family metallopeptidase [Verrucomicrobiota bacterium]